MNVRQRVSLIKSLLINHIKNNVPDSEVAVLLSGGVDSVSVGLAAENAGKEVHAYSFYLNGPPSYDFIKAAEVAHKRNWNFTPIVVPTNNLIQDWHRLVKHGCRRKTHFECVFPFLYVYPQIEEKYVLTGWGADGYFGVSRKAMKRYSRDDKWDFYVEWCKKNKNTIKGKNRKDGFDIYRKQYLDGDCAGLKDHTNLATKHNKIHVTPYLNADIRKLLMSKSYEELNEPEQKHFIRKDFTELKKFGTIKPHQNLHLNAGVDKLFETLLNNPEINFRNRKRIMDVCKDWSHGVLPV